MADGVRCSNEACQVTQSSAWYGKGPHKYCRKSACIQVGKDRGHVSSRGSAKRAREDEETSFEGTTIPSIGALVTIHDVYGCRCASPSCFTSCRPRLRLSHTVAVLTRARPVRRLCDPQAIDDVESRNGVSAEYQVASLQYLVHGHFEVDERDIKGYDATR